MLKIVTKSSEVNKWQRQFENHLRKTLPKRKHHTIGHLGRNFNASVMTNDDIWFTSMRVGTSNSGRYWNAFGRFNKNTSSNIILEINFPLSGTNRRVAGIFATIPRSNRIYILHRGGIGGGREGIGKRAFLKWLGKNYPRKLTYVDEGQGQTAEAIRIAHLPSSNFLRDLNAFIDNVQKFKIWAVKKRTAKLS